VTQNGKSHISRPKDISQGISQGSILGPLLFLVYVNELAGWLNAKMVCQYTEDMSVMLADSLAVQYMENWCSENCLKLNLQKTGLN